MTETELRDYLKTLSTEEIINIAVALHNDAVRLRDELDKEQGIIR